MAELAELALVIDEFASTISRSFVLYLVNVIDIIEN